MTRLFRRLGRFVIRFKDLLDWTLEEASDLEGQGQAWIVLPPFERVDRLAGDAKLVSQVTLGPTLFLS